MPAITSRVLVALSATVVAVAAFGSGSALAQEGEQGRGILDAVESGELDCAEIDAADFSAVGEYVMGRMVGSQGAHRSMDELMETTMGGRNEERMHEAMGERFTGCGDSRLPGGYAGMMGVMGMMGGGPGSAGMMGGGPGSGGMMGDSGPGGEDGGLPGRGFGPAMMGFDRDDDDDVGAWMAVAMLLLVGLAVVAVVLVARAGRRPGGAAPLDLLAQRFARGEIGADEYAERRRLLEEGTR